MVWGGNMTKEIEYKALVTKEEFEGLLSNLNGRFACKEKVQVNVYYDTDTFSLFRKGETLRARIINETIHLEYKFNKQFVGNARMSEEKTLPIDRLLSRLGKREMVFLGLPDDIYSQLGRLTTHRTNIQFPECLLSLDRNEYCGYEDYEIELEVRETNTEWRKYLCMLDPKIFARPVCGKYSRFITCYLKSCSI